MAVSNHERVGKALALLSEGLAPFVERECRAKHGDGWLAVVTRSDPAATRGKKISATDTQTLLKVMADEWHGVFSRALGHSERALVSELREVRNAWAHQEAFSTDDTYRALDSVHRLLTAVSAADQAAEVDRQKQDLLRIRFEEQAKRTHRKAAVAPVEGNPSGGLRPWREVVTPHPDVASGRYQQAEFAADLHQVWRGEAASEYGDPTEFYRRTFLTDGLRKLLAGAVERLGGSGGDPVVELQTNFGGGKTHSLIALYHLASGLPAAELPGIEAALADAGVEQPPEARRVILVGQMISPGQEQVKDDGTKVRTLWGELAWQLGGRSAFDLLADSDATGTSPGSALVDLFKQYSPCLVLIDEWVAYARQLYGVDGLPAGSFDAQFTFAQALAEAARSVPGVFLVVSIPASDIEVGGEGGKLALERLQNVIGRMESPWRPASADEGFEIVRRRLFQPISGNDAFKDRDAVVRAFGELYRSQRAEFPAGAGEGEYERRLTAAYPIHPELFDRLYNEWSTLDKFQRTRGVLRLMAAVIHELWERDDRNLLILPATVPIDASAVTSELTRYLEEGWEPVIASDVDGPNSLPLRLDRENEGTLGRYSATRRVARTIYLGSAPTKDASNRGIDDRSIKLGCAQPGENPSTFGDALRRLSGNATYLYVDGQRYWYDTQQSVTKLAQDRAALQHDDEVDEEIRRRLRNLAERGDFVRVHSAVAGPNEVPDEAEARLVVLGPECAHSAKTEGSPALPTAKAILDSRGTGPRIHKNMLVFLAADHSRLDELRQAVRQWQAWKSIHGERGALNLDSFQRSLAETKLADADEAVKQRIPETWQWLLAPSQPDPNGDVVWDEARVSGVEPLAVRASRKLRTDEGLITEYSAARLRMDLDRVLWRDRDHVGVRDLWEWYAQYLYLPRLRDSAVMQEAIRQGLALFSWSTDTFAYAERYDESTGRYLGLVAGEQGVPVMLDGTSVLVKPEIAARQLGKERPTEVPISLVVEGDTPAEGDTTPPSVVVVADPHRFYGRVILEPVRLGRDVGQIAEAIVTHLAKLPDSQVTITVEVEAESAAGFPDGVRRTVSENARTLKFEAHEFEE